MLGQTQPVFPRETPPPTEARSRTTTSTPSCESSHAQASPTTPAPTTATFIAPMLVGGLSATPVALCARTGLRLPYERLAAARARVGVSGPGRGAAVRGGRRDGA